MIPKQIYMKQVDSGVVAIPLGFTVVFFFPWLWGVVITAGIPMVTHWLASLAYC